MNVTDKQWCHYAIPQSQTEQNPHRENNSLRISHKQQVLNIVSSLATDDFYLAVCQLNERRIFLTLSLILSDMLPCIVVCYNPGSVCVIRQCQSAQQHAVLPPDHLNVTQYSVGRRWYDTGARDVVIDDRYAYWCMLCIQFRVLQYYSDVTTILTVCALRVCPLLTMTTTQAM